VSTSSTPNAPQLLWRLHDLDQGSMTVIAPEPVASSHVVSGSRPRTFRLVPATLGDLNAEARPTPTAGEDVPPARTPAPQVSAVQPLPAQRTLPPAVQVPRVDVELQRGPDGQPTVLIATHTNQPPKLTRAPAAVPLTPPLKDWSTWQAAPVTRTWSWWTQNLEILLGNSLSVLLLALQYAVLIVALAGLAGLVLLFRQAGADTSFLHVAQLLGGLAAAAVFGPGLITMIGLGHYRTEFEPFI